MDKGRELPYYPNRYFRQQVVHWMVDNHQKVMQYMGQAIMVAYGVVDPTASHGGLFSYADYLKKLLERQFWGDEVILWSISMMWNLKISVATRRPFRNSGLGMTAPCVMWMWLLYIIPTPTTLLQVIQEICHLICSLLFTWLVTCAGHNGT